MTTLPRADCSRQILRLTLALATLTLAACGGSEPAEIPVLPTVAETAPSSVGGAPDYRVIDVVGGRRITGTIQVSGAIPSLPAREVDRDPAVCGGDDREALELIVAEDGGLANAMVLLEGITEGKPMPEPEGGMEDQSVRMRLLTSRPDRADERGVQHRQQRPDTP